MRKIYVVSLLFFLSFTHLIAQETLLRVDTCQLVTPLDITPYLSFLKDNQFKINQLSNQNFQPFTQEGADSLQPDATYWFRFTLKNKDALKDFNAIIYIEKQSTIELFEPDGRVLKNGRHSMVSERIFDRDWDMIPFSVAHLTEKRYFLRVKTLNKRPISASFKLVSDNYAREKRSAEQLKDAGGYFFTACFLIILVFVAVFSLIQGRLLRDKTYVYYALYLFTIALYFSRNFERAFDYPILFSRYRIIYDLSEVYLSVASYLLYILFFGQFLDLPNLLPKINKILRGIFWTIVGLLGINVLIQIFGGIKAGLQFFDHVRIVFFAFVALYFYVLITLKGDRLTRLLGAGFLAIILPAIVSVFENITGSVLTDMYWGTWRHYDLGNWHYEFYDMEIGILIEIACFSTALYYKTKAERQKNAEMRQHFTSLSDEHETLKQQQTQAEINRLELAEKEAILQRQIALMKREVVDNQGNTLENDFILRGLKIIETNLENPNFSIEDFAKAMHLARGKFYADWKKATGQTPNESIQNARLLVVQRLLLTTDLTVAEIAHQTGFNESAYLSRVFQQKMGQSPSEFRSKKTH